MIRYTYLNSLSFLITKEIEMCYPRRNDCALTVFVQLLSADWIDQSERVL